MKPELSLRQSQVAELVARGLPDKVIAHQIGIDIETVRFHVKEVAKNIPGHATPRRKILLWFFNIDEG